jgi:hypothetical protein
MMRVVRSDRQEMTSRTGKMVNLTPQPGEEKEDREEGDW